MCKKPFSVDEASKLCQQSDSGSDQESEEETGGPFGRPQLKKRRKVCSSDESDAETDNSDPPYVPEMDENELPGTSGNNHLAVVVSTDSSSDTENEVHSQKILMLKELHHMWTGDSVSQ